MCSIESEWLVARFGPDAAPAVVALLKSSSCEDQKSGIAILADMWPVKTALVCDAD
jgi:hypothetical protein